MKDNNPKVSLMRFCRLLGLTRQSYYQHFWQEELVSIEHELVLQRVLEIRENHRHIGTRKLYEMLQPFLLEHQIKIGRDALFDLLASNCLLVRRKKRKITTTDSYHRFKKYPNLIRDFVPQKSNQLWVSDITYWKISNGFVYISFITDAYSRKIVGYHVAQTMEAVETIEALKMAISGFLNEPDCPFQLTHHSDRGMQYCSDMYVRLLKNNNINISMTENGDPLENAIAERINGIIKEEYLNDYTVDTIEQAKELLSAVVKLYNNERPHQSIGFLTPNQVHEKNIKTEKLWKNYYQKNTIIVNQLQD
ncbi:IS3 family transposase [Flavobacterium lacus]|uniref:Transposase InsO family protein n=1 Tax=Flavobacterium lacus TaxID=1353778 RepID=A0A328WLS8_9FLAO|nr:IS3 family transposase [Flavobacterium lacus]RAR46195.1 transposase InsO family protein [Flavobacterium lacus]